MTTPFVLVVIQSRLASTRLPAKALLPIGGMPAVVLCARRAANTGLPIVVATSNESTDDPIAERLAVEGIPCFRGSHDDVLARFAAATASLPDDGAVVRLTADNLFPDGGFIEELLDTFATRGCDYLGTSSPQDGLPYGLSAEVFSARLLRLAHRTAATFDEREHVTPWIRRRAGAARPSVSGRLPHWTRLRCTIDTFDDYIALQRVFADVGDPVAEPWRALVERLSIGTPHGREPRCPYRETDDGMLQSVLTLGTAQFGMPYGIANQTGMPDDEEIASLLRNAVDAGVTTLDTARAYGASEERIGRLLRPGARERLGLVTKLGLLEGVGADASPADVRAAVEASVFRSAHALRVRRIDTLLLHRWAHRHAWQGAAWSALGALRQEGVIGKVGASVAHPAEAIEALADPAIEHLQCPVNILDGRWRNEDFLRAVEGRPDVTIHARSALLQGLLALPPAQWVRVPGVDSVRLTDTLDRLAQDFGRADRIDLCFAYVRSMPWVHSIVVGMETRQQLEFNLAAVQSPPLPDGALAAIAERIPPLPSALLDPALWRAHA